MTASKVNSDKAKLSAARESVITARSELSSLETAFNVEKQNRIDAAKAVEYELSNCRNGVARDKVIIELERVNSETREIIKAWKRDISDASCALADAESEFSQLKNDVLLKEFNTFKDSIDINAVFRAYAFHQNTFEGCDWRRFLQSLIRMPESAEMEPHYSEINALIM